MLNFSPEKLFLVALIALIVLGPTVCRRRPGRLGRFMAEMRRMSASFQDEVRDALGEPTEAFHSAMAEFRPALESAPSVRDAITTTFDARRRRGPAAAARLAAAAARRPPIPATRRSRGRRARSADARRPVA